MQTPKENKSVTPANLTPDPSPSGEGSKLVKVKIHAGCLIIGYGKGESIVDMPEALAKQYERDGSVTILSKGE